MTIPKNDRKMMLVKLAMTLRNIADVLRSEPGDAVLSIELGAMAERVKREVEK